MVNILFITVTSMTANHDYYNRKYGNVIKSIDFCSIDLKWPL